MYERISLCVSFYFSVSVPICLFLSPSTHTCTHMHVHFKCLQQDSFVTWLRFPFPHVTSDFSQNILQQNGHSEKTKGGRQKPKYLALRTRCFRILCSTCSCLCDKERGRLSRRMKDYGRKMSKITMCPEKSKGTIWDGKLITKESLSSRKP